jgi:hypothetical protein
LNEEISDEIPEYWYEKTNSQFICLRCHRAFIRKYMSKGFPSGKKAHGANMFSLWAWYNFRRHLLKCWGWRGGRDDARKRLK